MALNGGSPLLGVYRQPDFRIVAGEGCELTDEEGRRYLDFTAGIAVNALGYASPVIRRAVEEALDTGVIHTSNLFRTPTGEALARRLVEASGLDRAFFCNSGAEATEGALKFARRWAGTLGKPEKRGFLAVQGAFHGRLFGSLALTDRPAYQEPFLPLMPGATHVDPWDDAALDRALDPDRVAAFVVEPIQGEGGIHPFPTERLRHFRALTAERGIALVLDEIQCGLGRTGELFAHTPSGVRPDLLILAKPIGGGFPMGVVLLSEEMAATLRPGDHGTTFGGGPLVTRVALAVFETLADPAFLTGVRERGRVLEDGLRSLHSRFPERIREVRGRGLMWGVEFTDAVGPVVEAARERGLLLVGAGANVIRFVPPLIITPDEIRRGVEILGEAIAATAAVGAAS